MTHTLSKTLCQTQQWNVLMNGIASGPRQRLQPGGRICVVMTRWAVDDLTGRLIKAQKEPKADKWKVIEFPAILPNDKPVWPEYWNKEDLDSVKASIVCKKLECTIHARSNFRKKVQSLKEIGGKFGIKNIYQNYYMSYKVMILRFQRKETADYSAITTWGIFEPVEGYEEMYYVIRCTRRDVMIFLI